MNDSSNEMLSALGNNKFIKGCYDGLVVEGENPWELMIDMVWKDVGKVRILPLTLSDFWALREWWNSSLTHHSKYLAFLFPDNEKKGRYIANHIKAHQTRRSFVLNAWLIKDGPALGLDNEIIGQFFLLECQTDKPIVGIMIADKFQGKKLGTLFMSILIYTAKMLGKKILWLTTSKDNKAGYALYKKLGFEDVGDKEVCVHTEGYKRMEYEMKLDLDSFA